MTAEQLAKLNKLAERWANEPPEADNEYDIATDVMDLLPDVLDHIKQLAAERDAALKACAEMRSILNWQCSCHAVDDHYADCSFKRKMAISNALSTDCGKEYVHKRELEPLVEALEKCVISLGFAGDEHWKIREIGKQALAHAERLMEEK